MIFNYFEIVLWTNNYLLVTAENLPLANDFDFKHIADSLLLQTAFYLKTTIECIALLILASGIIKTIIKLLAVRKRINRPKALCSVRLDLGLSLVLSLEFLLAADIAGTSISPSWNALGKLAAISGIRTFLNYFLQKEIKELENHQ